MVKFYTCMASVWVHQELRRASERVQEDHCSGPPKMAPKSELSGTKCGNSSRFMVKHARQADVSPRPAMDWPSRTYGVLLTAARNHALAFFKQWDQYVRLVYGIKKKKRTHMSTILHLTIPLDSPFCKVLIIPYVLRSLTFSITCRFYFSHIHHQNNHRRQRQVVQYIPVSFRTIMKLSVTLCIFSKEKA